MFAGDIINDYDDKAGAISEENSDHFDEKWKKNKKNNQDDDSSSSSNSDDSKDKINK